MNRLANFYLAGAVDKTSFARTLRREGSFFPYFLSPHTLYRLGMFPKRLYYLEYPNFDNAKDKEVLSRRYDRVRTLVVGTHGYTLPIHELALRLPSRGE